MTQTAHMDPSHGAGAPNVADELGMHLLAAHIPLTLLFDLVVAGGPPSEEILRVETAQLDWIPQFSGAGRPDDATLA